MELKTCAIGVDLGGTKIALGTVDEQGHVLELIRYDTDARGGPDAVIKQVVKGVRQLERETTFSIRGIGIGVAGQVEHGSGVVHFAPNLDWHDVPLKAGLEKASGLPAVVMNDVRAALWGEWLF